MLIITKHLDIGGAEKMLLRFLPVFISLGYKIDLYLLYNYRIYTTNHLTFRFLTLSHTATAILESAQP